MKARRQRNLTTSIEFNNNNNLSTESTGSSQLVNNLNKDDDCYDQFLNSLEDINDYLDKKLTKTKSLLLAANTNNKKAYKEQEIENNEYCDLIESNTNTIDTKNILINKSRIDTYQPKINKSSNRKSRRFFTQPIILNQLATTANNIK